MKLTIIVNSEWVDSETLTNAVMEAAKKIHDKMEGPSKVSVFMELPYHPYTNDLLRSWEIV